MITYYSVTLNPIQSKVFSCLCNELKEKDSFSEADFKISKFSSFSFNELASIAKKDQLAQEEFLNRLSRYILNVSYYIKNPRVDCLNELISTGYHAAKNALSSFDENKGQASHFLTSSIKRSILMKYYKLIKMKNKKEEFLKNLYESIYSNNSSSFEQKSYFIHDYNSFTKKLTPSSKHLLDLYSTGSTFAEISKLTNQTYGMTFVKINKLLKSLKHYLHEGKIKYISNKF